MTLLDIEANKPFILIIDTRIGTDDSMSLAVNGGKLRLSFYNHLTISTNPFAIISKGLLFANSGVNNADSNYFSNIYYYTSVIVSAFDEHNKAGFGNDTAVCQKVPEQDYNFNVEKMIVKFE